MSETTVPFLDLVTPHLEMEADLVAAFRRAIGSAQFIGGPEVESFEREFAAFSGTTFCVGVASGTDALRFALMAAGITAGDAVITVAQTFIATVEAISQAGAATEFVDIDERTYNLSPTALAAYLDQCRRDPVTGRPLGQRSGKPVKGIVPVHLYGQMADMDAIADIADRYGLVLVEDACQAHGARYLHGRAGDPGTAAWASAGSLGKAGAFSFYPGKNLGACGEGGAITTNDAEVARIARMLRDHGQAQKYYHDLEGYNGRLDAIQAAFLRIKLNRLHDWNQQRRSAADRYNRLLADAVTTPTEYSWSRSVYHLYVIATDNRDGLSAHLRAEGIQTGLHYPVPVHLQACYRHWGYRPGDLPVTERAAARILSLPMFPGLTPEHQDRVASAVGAFVHAGSRI